MINQSKKLMMYFLIGYILFLYLIRRFKVDRGYMRADINIYYLI